MNRPKRILFLCEPCLGGAERMMVLYAKILKKAGFECSFLVFLHDNTDFLLKQLLTEDLKLYAYTVSKRMGRIQILRFAKFFAFHKTFDCIFLSKPSNLLYLKPLKKLGLLPNHIVLRDKLMPSNYNLSNESFSKIVKEICSLVIAQTEEMKAEGLLYYQIDPSKIVTIYNPLDLENIEAKRMEKYPFDNDYVNYVAANRIEKQKDIGTMLQAFSLLLKKQMNSRLYILGNIVKQEYYEELKNICKQLNIEDKVFWEGQQSNPFKYIAHCDCFVLSSIYEGLPNAMMEALYLGIPVAVTRSIPFISQVIKDGTNGYSVPVRNPEALSEAMFKACAIEQSLRKSAHYDTEIIIIDTFRNLLEKCHKK